MEPLRIAVYHNLPTGGAKRTLHDMVERLSRRHRLDCFSLSCSAHEFCDLRPYVQNMHTYEFHPTSLLRSPLGRINPLLRLRDLFRLASLSRRIAGDINAGDYDVAFVHPSQHTQAPTVLRFLRLPSLYYCQEPLRRLYEPLDYHTRPESKRWQMDPARALYDSVLSRVDRGNVRAASRVLVNSRFSSQSVRRAYGVGAEVCYHGVDVGLFRPMGLARENLVLSVGALVPAKGHDLVVRSLGFIPPSLRPRLVIVSNFQKRIERHYLERLAQECGVELTIRTMVSDEELVMWYNRARVTAYAPHLEPFGLVPLESMACRTPVVGVREGGVTETVLDGETGLLVERDPQAFAQAIQAICTNPNLAATYGDRGRNYVEELWTWEYRLRLLEEHLSEIAHIGSESAHTMKVREGAGA